MTKADRVNAIVALVMMAMLTLMGHRIQGNNVFFAVGFPATMWVLWFWINRALTTRALAKQTESEVVFERPMILRSLFGSTGVFLGALMATAVRQEMRDAALYQRSTGVETSTAEAVLMLFVLAVFVGLPCLLFLWLAGPQWIRFDLNDCRYCFTQGLPPLTQTGQGATDGGTFSVRKVRAARHQLRFRPSGHKWGQLLDTYDTDEQARTQAHGLADKLRGNVERRDTVLQ